MRSLEVEAANNHEEEEDSDTDERNDSGSHQSGRSKRRRRRSISPDPPGWVIRLRYCTLSAASIFLALSCPGQTMLWGKEGDFSVIDRIVLFNLLVPTLLTYVVFFLLQGSDPGYLTPEIVHELDLEDEVSLLQNDEENLHQTTDETSDFSLALDDGDHNVASVGDEEHLNTVSRRSLPSNHSPQITESLETKHSIPSSNHNETPYFRGIRRKFCHTCQLAPPLRAHHCNRCNRCVATFDHHCQFLGTCIGERNHCLFWWFLLGQTATLYFQSSIVSSSQMGMWNCLFQHHKNGNTMAQCARVVLAEGYIYLLVTASLVMWVIHTVWCLTNSTTFECAKGRKLDYMKGAAENLMDLPFSRPSVLGNVRLFCYERAASTNNDIVCRQSSSRWKPVAWKPPGKIIRDSEDWWEHPLQNKYWSCC